MDRRHDYNSLMHDAFDYSEILEALIDNLPIPCSVVDAQGNFTLINKLYEKTFQIERAELLGRHYSCHVLPEGKSVHQVVLKKRRPFSDVKKMGSDGRLVQVDGYPVALGGRFLCSIAVVHEFASVQRTMHALDRARELLWNASSPNMSYSFEHILFQSGCMAEIVHKAQKAAHTDVTVLLRGESGTGKEVFAHAIHNASARNKGPFLRVNCNALTESLLETILFGYVDGAFTGAKKGGDKGLFEAADGGTIFLDEIGDISLALQTKLLRVLQNREFMRVGETEPRYADVRVIAATHANLEENIRVGSFRQDLYYRLNIFPIMIPPLRERREDISLLAEAFCKRFGLEYEKDVVGLEESCIQKLLQHHWPGNVRELENTIARAVIDMLPEQHIVSEKNVTFLALDAASTEDGFFLAEDSEQSGEGYHLSSMERGKALPASDSDAGTEHHIPDAWHDKALPYKTLFLLWEKAMLEDVWTQEGKSKTKMASRLRLSVRSIYGKLKSHGIV